MSLDIHAVYRTMNARFRAERMKRFLRTFDVDSTTKILDIGGTRSFWETHGVDANITLLNVRDESGNDRFRFVRADATCLPFEDGEFDICFSNSLIEHLYTWDRQVEMAREARRVGRGLWVQTPAKSFPIEPHFLTAGLHWLPKSTQKRALRYGSVWGLVTRPNRPQVSDIVDEIRLLNQPEMRTLFPDCELLRERFLGVTKSFIAVRRLSR